MTNKPMLSVEREVIEKALRDALTIRFDTDSHVKKLRALLDKEVDGDSHAPKHQGVPPLIATLHENGEFIAAQATIAQQAKLIYLLRAGRQGVPVVCVELVENKIHGGMHIVKWDNLGKLKEGIHKLYAEQPEPAADHTQCEECKGWGYHENHYEGGGTECGECGGSGNSPVAVVMPERLNTEGGYSLEAETWYNLALDDVARLNGVKP